MGRRHADAAGSTTDLEVRLFSDHDQTRADDFAGTYGGTAVSAAEALQSPEIDAVIVATHHESHAALVLEAARAGKHLLLEPPLGTTAASTRTAARALEAAGVRALIGFQMRFEPLVNLARRLIPTPRFVHGQLFGARLADGAWQLDPASGGEPIWWAGPAVFDLVCHFMQAGPQRVHAEGGALTHPGVPEIDSAVCTLRFDGGGGASIAITDCGVPPGAGALALELTDGKRRVALWDDAQTAELFGFTPADLDRVSLDSIDVEWGDDGTARALAVAGGVAAWNPAVRQLEAFRDFVRGGGAPDAAASVDDGLRASALTLAVLASIRSGRTRVLRRA
jgi:predicted dehydrogenase